MDPEIEIEEDGGEDLVLVLGPEAAGERLDKALAAVTELSRARLQALIADGALTLDGKLLTDGSARARSGEYRLRGVDVPVSLPAPREVRDLDRDVRRGGEDLP